MQVRCRLRVRFLPPRVKYLTRRVIFLTCSAWGRNLTRCLGPAGPFLGRYLQLPGARFAGGGLRGFPTVIEDVEDVAGPGVGGGRHQVDAQAQPAAGG